MLIEDKKDYSLQLFAKVEHGFALRGNPDDPYEREYRLCAPIYCTTKCCNGLTLVYAHRLGKGAEPSGHHRLV